MTIAVGIMGPDFLIVAADSQATWANLTTAAQKISIATLTVRNGIKIIRGRVAITGAGDADLLSYLKGRIAVRVQSAKHDESKFLTGVRADIEAEVSDFYATHWVTLANLPGYENAEPSMLVGAQFGSVRGLWVTGGSTVRGIGMGAVAVGSGRPWAEDLLNSTLYYLTREHAATLAACYAVFTAKQHTQFCGSETVVLSLRGNRGDLLAEAKQDAVREAEDIFREYDELKTEMFGMVVAPSQMNVTVAATDRLSEIRDKLEKIDFYPKPRRGAGRQ